MDNLTEARLREFAADSGYSHSDYADTMLEAAAELTALRAKVQELEQDKRQMSDDLFAIEKMHIDQKATLYGKLYASQLEVQRLREALLWLCGRCEEQGFYSPTRQKIIVEALATPTSTEALDAYVAEKVKEALARADLTVGIPMDAANDLPMIQCIESTVDAALVPIGYTRTDTDKADGYAALRYRRFGIALKPAEGE
jgi:hypothetical protein